MDKSIYEKYSFNFDNLINKDIAHLMDLSQRIRFLSNKQNEQRYIASINEHISILDAIKYYIKNQKI